MLPSLLTTIYWRLLKGLVRFSPFFQFIAWIIHGLSPLSWLVKSCLVVGAFFSSLMSLKQNVQRNVQKRCKDISMAAGLWEDAQEGGTGMRWERWVYEAFGLEGLSVVMLGRGSVILRNRSTQWQQELINRISQRWKDSVQCENI